MWFERFVIIVTSLANDFLPTSWDFFTPTWVDMGTMLGAFGLFGTLFLLFCRYLPMIAVAEVKATMPQADPHWEGWHHHGAGHGHAVPASPEAPHTPDAP
jgi:molybdopterin-containing oxidoreductase family membrane subunit